MTFRQLVILIVFGAWTLCGAGVAPVLAGPAVTGLENVARVDMLDAPACRVFVGGVGATTNPQELKELLDASGQGAGWSVAMPEGKSPATSFLLAFREPTEIGSVHFAGSARIVSVLKPGAAYPPDVSKADEWQPITVPPNQSGSSLVTLPGGTRTRALLFTDPQPWRSARLEWIRLLSTRIANITPIARIYAESEYTQYSSGGPPHTYSATAITTGSGSWQNTGKNNVAYIPRAPISDIDPAWVVLSWDEPQTIRGIWANDDFEQLRLESYNGPKELNPRAGTDAEWEPIRDEVLVPGPNRLISFPPQTTRGLRLTILKSKEDRIARIDGLHVFTTVKGDGSISVSPAVAPDVPPPVFIPYKIDSDGEATLVINGPDGRRARNVFARRQLAKGEYQTGWDLKDEQGRLVPQGSYEWKLITHPPLSLKYEMTVYPNVSENSPENPSWLTSMSGPGGWMADHTSNLSGAAGGDFVFFGAPVSESGVSFICCDLTGRKYWAIPSFGGFTGAYHIAADAKTAYVSAPGGNMGMDARAELVWSVDIATHQVREITHLLPTSKRQRGIQSMATRDGKIYLAVNAVEDWFSPAAGPDDVDIEKCTPHYAAPRKPRFDYEVPPDPRDDFLRLFRLTGQPAGGHALTYIESTPGKSPRRHVAILFNRPVPIGSAIYPQPQDPAIKVRLSLLKPDAPYPPNPGDPKQWEPFVTQGKLPWDVATAPPNTRARALRITFSRGDNTDDDLLGADDSAEFKVGATTGDSLKLKEKTEEDPTAGLNSGSGGSWIGQLEGLKIVSHRFENVAGSATVEVNSGAIGPAGVWDAQRNRALSDADPGIYALKWKTPQTLRGLALKEVDGRRTEIDVYTGPADKPIDIASPNGWKHVSTYWQARRITYWPHPRGNAGALYLDGYVDFGEEITTRALRLRVCEQWQDTEQGQVGPRFDVTGPKMDSTRCRIFGVAAMKYVGGDGTAVDSLAFQRIETLNPQTGKIEAELPLPKAVAMAFNSRATLYAISNHDVVTVDVATGNRTPIVTGDLLEPRAMAIDKAGKLYIYDQSPERRNIRVFNPAGKFLRTIGTPGGYRVGPWDPTRFQAVTTLVIDAKDQLWAVDNTYFPKRISLWSLDGTWKKDFFGNAAYGGGGVLDAKDKSRLFYGPLEFAIDWKTGHSRLKNITWLGDSKAGEEPVYLNGRNYMVTRFDPPEPRQDYGVVYIYEKDHLRRVAAMGHAAGFPPLTRPELQAALGNPVLYESNFVWTDRNGDGEVQADEVVIRRCKEKGDDESPLTRFNSDLSIQSQAIRFHVTGFLPNGAPTYEIQRMPGLAGFRNLYRLNDGNFQGINDPADGGYAPDGKPIWTYPDEGLSTQGLTVAKPYSPGQIVSEFGWVGHETAHAGDLGEFTVVHTNVGIWNIWTADGLLAGGIFSDLRRPGSRNWNMPEHARGMSLDDVTPGQEHFSGHFCRTADNQYYAVAGHNHISVVEVLGMDKFKRASGRVTIAPADVARTEAWAQASQRQNVYARTPVLDCYRIEAPLTIDGKTGKWDTVAAEFGEKLRGNLQRGAVLHAAWDAQYLYLCFETRSLGPLKNSGEQWDRLFKTGASVDLQIATDPNAPKDRKAPVAGDKRLLLTYVGDKPMAVLYDAVVPGTSPDVAWKAVSPVGQVSFDRVVQLANVKMARGMGDENYYSLEAAIPLDALGLKPVDDLRLKMDWGILASDSSGNSVMQRLYWSNGATGIIADVPSEARLHPDLWGYVLFHDRSRHIAAPTHSIHTHDGDDAAVTKKKSAKEIERELNGDK